MATVLAALAGALCLAAASDPSERLADPGQEARARTLFQQVRCVVCQNESIDDSEADLAHDLRQVVRAQVRQGRSDAEIKRFLVDRYGQFILLRPSFSLGNGLLWLAPLALLLGAGGFLMVRARSTAPATAPLSAAEEAELAALTGAETGRHGFASSELQEQRDSDRTAD
jgi:cytochrome c-type biogenesis protein CcmH